LAEENHALKELLCRAKHWGKMADTKIWIGKTPFKKPLFF